jgi:hypothetical protein
MNHPSARSAASSRVLQACAVPLLLLAAGCVDDHGVTDSRAAIGGVRRSSAPNESPFSWSEDLAGPSTNYENGGSIGWTGVPLAGGRWYRVRVTGQTSLINNPAWMNVCTQAGVDPCPPGTYVGSYGPEGVPGSSDLRVLVRTSSGYEFRWAGPGQEFVFFLPHGGTVQRMQRGLVSGITCLTAEPCRGRTGTWTGEYGFYAYTSRPRIEIEGAPIPVRVTADRSWAGPQDLVTYTAQADLPRVHDSANTWFYVPGDTAATPLFPSNEPVPVNACWGKTTCSFARGTYGPGRMYVNWYTKYGNAQNAGPVIGAQPPKLVLNCPASVQRGSAMTCTATAQGGAMQNLLWTFTDAAGNVISAPPGTSTTWGEPWWWEARCE